jgi:hypothetical protein
MILISFKNKDIRTHQRNLFELIVFPKIKKIFSTLTPSSGQTISSIVLSNISSESVLHKLSFGIKISRSPVDPKPYGKKTDFLNIQLSLFIITGIAKFINIISE